MPKMIEREDAAALVRRLVPGRIRLGLSIYDDAPESGKPGYRSLPGWGVIVNVRTLSQARRLWRMVSAVVSAGGWKDDGRDRVDSQPGAIRADVAGVGPAD